MLLLAPHPEVGRHEDIQPLPIEDTRHVRRLLARPGVLDELVGLQCVAADLLPPLRLDHIAADLGDLIQGSKDVGFQVHEGYEHVLGRARFYVRSTDLSTCKI